MIGEQRIGKCIEGKRSWSNLRYTFVGKMRKITEIIS